MEKTKIAIACQGGGSQTAFTAGALEGLREAWESDRFDLVSISGTSGGAVCGALLWYALCRGDKDPLERLAGFWEANTARGWAEEQYNRLILSGLQLVNAGMMPAFQVSPSSPAVRLVAPILASGTRREFTDFSAVLRKFIDFDEVASWGPRETGPALVIGAANVTSGRLVKFSSRQQAIRIEHILASCAVPSIFEAVMIDGEAYWDGLFSDNPPIEDLCRASVVGDGSIPDEIWLIKINPTRAARTPTSASDIIDRRNQVEGNISLFHQLDLLEFLNRLIAENAFRPTFLRQHDVQGGVRIPKAFASDPDEPWHIPLIEMPEALHARLTYEGKIDRSAANIGWLMEQGRAQAAAFMAARSACVGEPTEEPAWRRGRRAAG